MDEMTILALDVLIWVWRACKVLVVIAVGFSLAERLKVGVIKPVSKGVLPVTGAALGIMVIQTFYGFPGEVNRWEALMSEDKFILGEEG